MSTPDGVLPVNIEDELKKSYMDYAMSVIIGRALPDVRDGLKPVQRRILYTMQQAGLVHTHRYSKCAGVVGEVLGRYHPHGDQAVYDALVRMAQEWNMRYQLIDGQGNFGSVDGDPPAAYRYTECRLQRVAEEMLADIDKETVDFVANFDETRAEPTVLPARSPNLLINGGGGIAVGMATNIPPHNLREVVDAAVAVAENPEVELGELMRIVPGPDFPTGAAIHGRKGIHDAYTTGRGIVHIRAKAEVEINEKDNRQRILVHEIPYQVNKAKLIEKIAELVKNKRVEGITDVRDESDRHGMRIVIELRRGEDGSIILNQLYKHTALQSSFGIIMLAIVNKEPRVLNLKEMLALFLEHRRDVVVRRTRYELRKAEERAHILEGLKIALDHLDEVIRLIRSSGSPEEARTGLIERFELSTIQAQAILDMRLQKLTSLERDKIIQEYEAVLKLIAELREILANPHLVTRIITDELKELREKYGDDRRTEIVAQATDLDIEDLIADEDMVITLSHHGYVKRTSVDEYRGQRRGGKGRIGMKTKDEDFVETVFISSTLSNVLCFTQGGRMYVLKAYQIPEVGPASRGKAMVNLLRLGSDEKLAAVLPVRDLDTDGFIFTTTRRGLVKKTSLKAFANVNVRGIIAADIVDGDRLLAVMLTDGSREIVIGTRNGLGIRFKEADVREMGRATRGVIGVRLEDDDEVVGAFAIEDGQTVLSVAERGMVKRSQVDDYRLQGRGGKGVINMRLTEKTGKVIAVLGVSEDEQLMVTTEQGMILRTSLTDIRVAGRATQGVKLMDLDEGDRVTSVAKLAEREDDDSDGDDDAGGADGGEEAVGEQAAADGAATADSSGGETESGEAR